MGAPLWRFSLAGEDEVGGRVVGRGLRINSLRHLAGSAPPPLVRGFGVSVVRLSVLIALLCRGGLCGRPFWVYRRILGKWAQRNKKQASG